MESYGQVVQSFVLLLIERFSGRAMESYVALVENYKYLRRAR
jgi:hypothetical protein